ncbi:hypothetical protein [Streptomyces sp. NPDC004528]|uniref:hypothetical protein n=1 Tax=Streptomyces sp. NPDC004528 TaxID=3154550 RepID=UPI00339E5244
MTDNDGDVWTLNEETGYYSSRGLYDRTLAEIEEEFGPTSVTPSTATHADVRRLLADVLEDAARRLREEV